VQNPEVRKVIQNFVIEMVVYAVLVVGYFFLVLRLLAEPLYRLFTNNLIVYAVLALALIVAQGVVLEAVTSFIMGLLGLDQLE
jgi:glycerol uptake facilitator-like aquaporin